MELEFHQLDLRYSHLRRRAPEREKRLLASLAVSGQHVPIVVVGGDGVSQVVVDGYKRVRAVRQLKADTVLATVWQLAEAEALVCERLMRASGSDDVFEQGGLLRELGDRFGLSQPELGESWREEIVDQCVACKGNLVRVHEERVKKGATLSYPALTAFCRRHGIGHEAKKPAGHYDFQAGEEMQHDTSPHKAKIGGTLRNVQTASLVLCFSRMIYIQRYPNFTRVECKLFLTAALKYFDGTAGRCMIDNTHVVGLRGTGATMVPVPEMAAFSERLGFVFVAHEKGDANRSARVEGPFNYVERNFLAGREFEDGEHLNREAVLWCDKVNATYSRKLHASRRELFAAERPSLKPLPIWVPEVYVLHQRIVDLLLIDELGYLNLKPEQTNIFFKLMEERYRRRPTLITTNLDYAEWHTFWGNKPLVEALLSRLRHQCHTIKIKGPSLRDPQS